MPTTISDAVYDLFDTIAQRRSALFAVATSQSQTDVIQNAYLLSQALAEKFARRVFDLNDQNVINILNNINGVTTQLKNDLADLANIVETIDQLTSAVNAIAGLLSGLP